MVIADVIAHAIDPPLLFFHHQVVFLVRIQGCLADLVDLADQDKVQEVGQKVHEALDEKEHQDHQRRYILVVMESWYHLLLRAQVL